MSAETIAVKRRDPAVIAGRAHHVLGAVARARRDWPAEGQDVIGRNFLRLHVALSKYRAGAGGEGDASEAAENAELAMALLLIAVSVFLGVAVADRMMRDAAEVAK